MTMNREICYTSYQEAHRFVFLIVGKIMNFLESHL